MNIGMAQPIILIDFRFDRSSINKIPTITQAIIYFPLLLCSAYFVLDLISSFSLLIAPSFRQGFEYMIQLICEEYIQSVHGPDFQAQNIFLSSIHTGHKYSVRHLETDWLPPS